MRRASKAHYTFSSGAHVFLAKLSSQPAKQPPGVPFKRRGRNAKKHSTRFFVFPELVTRDPTAEHRLQASTTVSRLLKDLRVPTAGLPIRFFLAPEQHVPDAPATALPSRALAIPDFRTLQALAKSGHASTADTLTTLISTADSLRTLDALLSAGHASQPHDQARTTAAGFRRLHELVARAAASAYTHFPCNLHGGLPHVAASKCLQGQPVAAASTGAAALLLQSAHRLAQRRLLPALTDPPLLATMTPAELAGTAEAVVQLQAAAEAPLAPEFWERVLAAAHRGQFTVQQMGPASQISNAISRARNSLPPAALEAAERLEPRRTWLHPSSCHAAATLASELPASHTLACWLAAHGPQSSAHSTPRAPEAAAPLAPTAAAVQDTLPWRWLGHARTVVASGASPEEAAMQPQDAVRAALHSRLLQLSPDDSALGLGVPGGGFTWPQHGHAILSALHTPLDTRATRAALRPLFTIAETALMQPGSRDAAGSRRLIAVGHVLGLMDLANVSGAALTAHSSDAVQRVLALACEELQARTEMLSAHEVASSVLMLGEVLSMQGTYTRLQCDAAHGYLAGLFCSPAVQAHRFSSMERMMLCSGIQRLFGSRTRNAWCSQLQTHMAPHRADPASRRVRGPGKAAEVPMMHPFCQHVADLARAELTASNPGAPEEARCLLATFGAISMRYQDVIGFLRAAVAVLHADLRGAAAAGYANKALAHILFALGELRVPFETVYPLVLQICDLLQTRVPTMDATECYLVVDALAKLRTPTPEASPLLLAVMAHLAQGLDLRPQRPALHLNLLGTPPSQLIKLANAIKGFMPQTHGVVTREMQTAPKAAFVRLLVSHLMRHCAADLTHRDLIRILRLLKDSALGRDVPKPWTQDAALRIIDRFNSHLFGAAPKAVAAGRYWQDQELRDVTYLGAASAAPVPKPRRTPLTPQLQSEGAMSALAGLEGLTAADVLPDGYVHDEEGQGGLIGTEPVRWAYGKAYGVVQDSSQIILGSLKVMDWDTHLLHTVETLVANMGPRGLHGQPTVLDQTSSVEGTHMQVWQQAGYHGQDAPPEEPEPQYGGRMDGRGRGGRGRGGRDLAPTPFVVPHAPDLATLEDGGTNRPLQMHRAFEAFDAAQLLVAIADLYPDSASGGRALCRRVAPQLFSLFPPGSHRTADLARMLWALGVLADPADPQLRQAAIGSALRQCSRGMSRMHAKFTMMAMKGMATMARGGQLYSDGEAEAGKPWRRFLEAADTDEARGEVRTLANEANVFAKRAAGHLGSALTAEWSATRSCSLRPEGVGEAVRAAALLCPRSSATLATLWNVGAQVLRAHERPQEVPLRAVTAMLESTAAVRAGTPKHTLQVNTGALLKVARTRLLHGRRRVAPLQVRRFVAALRHTAPHVAVRDGGLLAAILRESAGTPMIANVKRRGRVGAERFVRMFEDIAELRDYGVVFSAAGPEGLDGGAAAVADATLVQRLEGLLADVEAANVRQPPADAAEQGARAGAGSVGEERGDDDDGSESDVFEAELEAAGQPSERLDYSLEGRVGRMQWKETAWDDELTWRLQSALGTILGR